MRALRTPIVPIPTGSANSLNLSLQGAADVFDVHLACLNVIKGIVTPIDLMSVLLQPSGVRRFGFLSIAIGLMYDLDIGTEGLRWMGDVRFVLGAVRGFISRKNVRCRVHMKVVEADKLEMVKHARERVKEQDEEKAARLAQRPTLSVGTGAEALRAKSDESAEYHTPATTTPLSVETTATDSTAELHGAQNGIQDTATSPSSPSAVPGGSGQSAAHSELTEESLAAQNAANLEAPSETIDGGSARMQQVESEQDHGGAMPPQRPLEPDSTWRTIETRSSGASQATKATGLASKVGPSATAENRGTWHDGEGLIYLLYVWRFRSVHADLCSAGIMPWASRDLLQWPVATSGQGVIDVVFQSMVR